jgi:predicted polyphosphate/ATP-dependent NAD kinase
MKIVKKLGLIVNPIAGLGGSVALKGSDGVDVIRKAKKMGAITRAPQRAVETLKELARVDNLKVITYPGAMGEDEAHAAGLEPTVIGSVVDENTSCDDTRRAATEMEKCGVDLILFAGGDGTARDVCEAVGERIPVLGIPAGVKMHSGVYATTPRAAGLVAAQFLSESPDTRLAEVMDIDEDAFREGRVSATLKGYLRIPADTAYVQSTKSPSSGSEADAISSIAAEVVDSMFDGCLYILGPGTTTREIAEELGVAKTLLGVDVVLDKKTIAADLTEAQLLELLDSERPAKIIVTVIGGQGNIFGRGNQQISAEVIRRVGKENLIIVATRQKLADLGRQPLVVDTGAPEVDELLRGYITVTTGRSESAMVRVA